MSAAAAATCRSSWREWSGARGCVVGVDLDAVKIEAARAEAVAAGVENVEFRQGELAPAAMQVVQLAALRGEVKLINAVTMEAIAESVLAAGLATRAEIAAIVAELYRLGRDETTVMSIPRIVQSWGRKRT
jgi:hypothetical protein